MYIGPVLLKDIQTSRPLLPKCCAIFFIPKIAVFLNVATAIVAANFVQCNNNFPIWNKNCKPKFRFEVSGKHKKKCNRVENFPFALETNGTLLVLKNFLLLWKQTEFCSCWKVSFCFGNKTEFCSCWKVSFCFGFKRNSVCTEAAKGRLSAWSDYACIER